MDLTEDEEKLKQILEYVQKEIADDILERIIKTQEKFNYQDINVAQIIGNGTNQTGCNRRRYVSTSNVATTTELDLPPESNILDSGTISECVTNPLAEKKVSKKLVAEEKKALHAANKMYKPGECMKHVTVEMHPGLCGAWYAADVAREVGAAGARVRAAAALCSPALVLWARAARPRLAAHQGEVQLAAQQEGCGRALYVATAEELAELVATKSLSQKMNQMRQLTNCQITILLFGAEEYFKPSGRKRTNNQRNQVTEIELEMALTDALVTSGCDTARAETPNELALTIVHFTKAIAEAPYKISKRQGEEQAQFYMRGDNKKCVPVTRDGAGLRALWQQMLAVLPMSSLERARALCAHHASPLRLYQELQRPDGLSRIADIGVSRSAAPGAVARRTGLEFARKLALLFTADDGDTLLH